MPKPPAERTPKRTPKGAAGRTPKEPEKPKGKPRGRSAPHVPTAASRRRVQLSAGMGIGQREIAVLEDLSVPALRKHYASELATGPVKCKFNVRLSVYKGATRENAKPEAQKLWLSLIEGFEGGGGGAKLGKKQQQQLDALTAEEGSEWAGLLN